MSAELSVEPVGPIVLARVRGKPTFGVLTECQARVEQLLEKSPKPWVLYDARELIAPDASLAWSQRALDSTLRLRPKRAIVVPDKQVAYLARFAFADEFSDNRVFYNDMDAAFDWLQSD